MAHPDMVISSIISDHGVKFMLREVVFCYLKDI